MKEGNRNCEYRVVVSHYRYEHELRKAIYLAGGLRLDLVTQLLADAPDVRRGGLVGGVRPKPGHALHELLVDAVAAVVRLRAALGLGLCAGAAALESCEQQSFNI